MNEPTDQFKRTPRRKGDRGRSVTISDDAKRAYAELMHEREKRENDYAKHLPATPGRSR